jgi:hypothetical protein
MEYRIMRVSACRRARRLQSWLLTGAVLLLSCPNHVGPASAEPSTSTAATRVDCRYEGIGLARGTGEEPSQIEIFPGNDVFRPLLADPKQPQFFASWQATRLRSAPRVRNETYLNIGSVGFGENIGLVGSRNGCDGWQVGILGGIFSQFNLDAGSTDLINTDYVIGLPVSWRRGLVSTRVRLYHQSSHLGDEFLLGDPGFPREDLSFEALEGIVSLDAPGGWGRLYAGGTYLLRRTPDLDRAGVQAGFELRGPSTRAPILRAQLPRLRFTPVFGADFKSFEELGWNVDVSAVGGVELSREGSDRRLRLLANYYRGHAPFGQFYGQKIEMVGAGLYFSF